MSNLCLTLLCPPTIEEKLLDLLLMSAIPVIFTSILTAAHGLSIERLNQTEQVLGRALSTQIQVILAATDKIALIEDIRGQFAGAGLHYWITPVVEAGEIL